MLQWRYDAANDAIGSEIGSLSGGVLQASGREGFLVTGPYIDVPGGHYIARLVLSGRGVGKAVLQLATDLSETIIASAPINLATVEGDVSIGAYLPDGARKMEVRLWCEEGCDAGITALEIDAVPTLPATHDPQRQVGSETLKSYPQKVASGFIDRFLSGEAILEVGFRGYDDGALPIVPQAIGVDIGYPGYDGVRLPFADGSFDGIYSSHCLEHVPDWKAALRDWYRVLKIGGHLVIAVPHQHLFEKRRSLPSLANFDHQRFYTSESLLHELAEAFGENGYRIRSLVENDAGYDYSRPPGVPAIGNYEIEVAVEKIARPNWSCEDGSVRPYAASEFVTECDRADPWSLMLPAPEGDKFLFWGPYIALEPGTYQAQFFFDVSRLQSPLDGAVTLEAAVNSAAVARRTLSGEEGLRALRDGTATLDFRSEGGAPNAFEFRLAVSARSYDGVLIFRGMDLRRA